MKMRRRLSGSIDQDRTELSSGAHEARLRAGWRWRGLDCTTLAQAAPDTLHQNFIALHQKSVPSLFTRALCNCYRPRPLAITMHLNLARIQLHKTFYNNCQTNMPNISSQNSNCGCKKVLWCSMYTIRVLTSPMMPVFSWPWLQQTPISGMYQIFPPVSFYRHWEYKFKQ